MAFERRIAPYFILGDEYGTRASTVITMAQNGLAFTEQIYHAGGERGERVHYQLPIEHSQT